MSVTVFDPARLTPWSRDLLTGRIPGAVEAFAGVAQLERALATADPAQRDAMLTALRGLERYVCFVADMAAAHAARA